MMGDEVVTIGVPCCCSFQRRSQWMFRLRLLQVSWRSLVCYAPANNATSLPLLLSPTDTSRGTPGSRFWVSSLLRTGQGNSTSRRSTSQSNTSTLDSTCTAYYWYGTCKFTEACCLLTCIKASMQAVAVYLLPPSRSIMSKTLIC